MLERATDVGVAQHGLAERSGGEHPRGAQQHGLGAQRSGQLQRGAACLVLEQGAAEVAEHLDDVRDPRPPDGVDLARHLAQRGAPRREPDPRAPQRGLAQVAGGRDAQLPRDRSSPPNTSTTWHSRSL